MLAEDGRIFADSPEVSHRSRKKWREVLVIDLQEGFDGDTVTVAVNGTEVIRRAHVTTKNQIGWAYVSERVEAQGDVLVEIRLSERNIEGATRVHVTQPVYLGISIATDGSVSWQPSPTPHGYL
jgi:hypothetical protein